MMSDLAYCKYSCACEAFNIDVYFKFNNTVVFNTENAKITKSCLASKKCREIVMITECSVEQYNGPAEIFRNCRGQILTIQGILSFFTGFPLTVYNNCKTSAGLNPFKYDQKDTCLIIDNVDFTSELIKMLERIEEEPKLIVTLLDRWRKAIFLRSESCDADLYYDEATLNFFHIFELFGECYAKELKDKLEKNIENMLEKHFKSFYLTETQVKQMANQNKKSINSILIGDQLNLSVKIKYFLEKYKMLDDNVSFFVDNIIKIRNAIAHGRITYQDKFIWPLPPFFNLAKDSYENIEFLFFITANMISKYIGINVWEKEWEEAKKNILPSKEIVESFINNKLTIENFNGSMLFDGNKYNITWRTLFYHYIKNPNKVFLENMEAKLKKYFQELHINEENAPDIFNISLLLADSEDIIIKGKAADNIKVIIKKNWYGWSDFKDAYSYLDFYHVKIKWYKDFLDSKGYLHLRK